MRNRPVFPVLLWCICWNGVTGRICRATVRCWRLHCTIFRTVEIFLQKTNRWSGCIRHFWIGKENSPIESNVFCLPLLPLQMPVTMRCGKKSASAPVVLPNNFVETLVLMVEMCWCFVRASCCSRRMILPNIWWKGLCWAVIAFKVTRKRRRRPRGRKNQGLSDTFYLEERSLPRNCART